MTNRTNKLVAALMAALCAGAIAGSVAVAQAQPTPTPTPTPPPSVVDQPEPGDSPDGIAAADTDNVQEGDQNGPETPDIPAPPPPQGR
jgi:hypothetical protein